MMPFNQFKLDRATTQTRGIFNKYVYETNDDITVVLSPGYFSQSRFKELDSDDTNSMGWASGFIEMVCSGEYFLGKITQDGDSAILVSPDLAIESETKTSSFEAEVNVRYGVDSSGTAGSLVITIAPGWPANGKFRIQDIAASWTAIDFVTVDFVSSGYMFNGVAQNYEGNVPNDGATFILRDQLYGFELL